MLFFCGVIFSEINQIHLIFKKYLFTWITTFNKGKKFKIPIEIKIKGQIDSLHTGVNNNVARPLPKNV